jgi:hypothetical protein
VESNEPTLIFSIGQTRLLSFSIAITITWGGYPVVNLTGLQTISMVPSSLLLLIATSMFVGLLC